MCNGIVHLMQNMIYRRRYNEMASIKDKLIATHMVHGKQFLSTISYSSVYVGRHTVTPTYIKDKLCMRRNYVLCHILSKECVTTSSYNWLLKFLKKFFSQEPALMITILLHVMPYLATIKCY